MTYNKLHSPWPYFILTALLGLVPVLNNKFPSAFFPAVPASGVEVLSVMLGILAASLGFLRGWNQLQQKAAAKAFLSQVLERLPGLTPKDPLEVGQSNRIISRMVRNVDEDLREIGPDFTADSLKRLHRFLPLLLNEIQNEEDAFIRIGVVGTYLGETKCRNGGWEWFFKEDPSLRQFGYLASAIQRKASPVDEPVGLKNSMMVADPFGMAAQWLLGNYGLSTVLKWL